MNPGDRLRRFVIGSTGGVLTAFAVFFLAAMAAPRSALASCQCGKSGPHLFCAHRVAGHPPGPGDISNVESAGNWYWMRSPEQERRVVMNLYNRYCIRCHGVDGRGVWDIPDVPDFTNTVWQATRPDAYRTRVILEGRGAVMPTFRGILTLEESCAMARYLHTFVPGAEVSRPGLGPAQTSPASSSSSSSSSSSRSTSSSRAAAPAVAPPPATTPSPFTR